MTFSKLGNFSTILTPYGASKLFRSALLDSIIPMIIVADLDPITPGLESSSPLGYPQYKKSH